MEQQAATTIPISFAPAIPCHAITPSSNNNFQDSVDHGDTIVIVCALAAPNNTDGPFIAKRKRRTFWTACASCNKKSKHSIEHLDSNISCPQCNTTFNATEVSRPRNQPTSTAENVHSRAIVTSPGTMVEPSKLISTVETPLPKWVKRDINTTQAAGKHGGNIKGINAISNDEINRLLVEPRKLKATVETPLSNRVKRDINVTQAAGNHKGINAITKDEINRLLVEPSKLKPIVETPLPKRVKRDINATQAAGKHGGNDKGINAITKDEINRLLVEPTKLKPIVETPLPKRVKRDINVTHVASKHGGNLKGINAIAKKEIKRLLKSKGWNMVIEARINGNNVGQ